MAPSISRKDMASFLRPTVARPTNSRPAIAALVFARGAGAAHLDHALCRAGHENGRAIRRRLDHDRDCEKLRARRSSSHAPSVSSCSTLAMSMIMRCADLLLKRNSVDEPFQRPRMSGGPRPRRDKGRRFAAGGESKSWLAHRIVSRPQHPGKS